VHRSLACHDLRRFGDRPLLEMRPAVLGATPPVSSSRDTRQHTGFKSSKFALSNPLSCQDQPLTTVSLPKACNTATCIP
jgi:hypothetical protein